MGSVRVASIAYAVGSYIKKMKFVCWEELSFLAWERTNDPSGAARRALHACECDVDSSRSENRMAPIACIAC
jgi:hypothetical protein